MGIVTGRRKAPRLRSQASRRPVCFLGLGAKWGEDPIPMGPAPRHHVLRLWNEGRVSFRGQNSMGTLRPRGACQAPLSRSRPYIFAAHERFDPRPARTPAPAHGLVFARSRLPANRVRAGRHPAGRGRDLRHRPERALRDERPVPPLAAGLALEARAQADRPLRDLRVHRGQLHADRGARARAAEQHDRARERLGRRVPWRPVQRRVDRRSAARGRGRLHRGRLGDRDRATRGLRRDRRRSGRALPGGRAPLLGRRCRLRAPAARPLAAHLRLPRALPRARDRGRLTSLRRDGGLGHPSRRLDA